MRRRNLSENKNYRTKQDRLSSKKYSNQNRNIYKHHKNRQSHLEGGPFGMDFKPHQLRENITKDISEWNDLMFKTSLMERNKNSLAPKMTPKGLELRNSRISQNSNNSLVKGKIKRQKTAVKEKVSHENLSNKNMISTFFPVKNKKFPVYKSIQIESEAKETIIKKKNSKEDPTFHPERPSKKG